MPPMPCPAYAAAPTALFCLLTAVCLFIAPATAWPQTTLNLTPAATQTPQAPATDALSRTAMELEVWLDTHAPWPAREALPRIVVVSDADMVLIGGSPGRGQGRRRGLYDPDSEIIFLAGPWSADSAFDRSVLLHELAHHRQAPLHWYCPAAQEPPAYRLQEAYLADHGHGLEVNWFAILWDAGCTARDIHPD